MPSTCKVIGKPKMYMLYKMKILLTKVLVFNIKLFLMFIGRLLQIVQSTTKTEIDTNPAFYAYMSADMPAPSPHHTFVYDHPVTNIGGNYNQHSGIFTVTQSGVYFMSATTITSFHGLIYFEIVKNSSPIATGLSNSVSVGNYHTGTIMAVVYAEKDDVIFVRSQNPPPPSDSSPSQGTIKSRSWARTSFCGWKIA